MQVSPGGKVLQIVGCWSGNEAIVSMPTSIKPTYFYPEFMAFVLPPFLREMQKVFV